jgi:ABC-2 type transport system permease protein
MWTSKPFIIDVGIIDKDNDEISKILINDVFSSENLKDMLNLTYLNSDEEAKEEINSGKLAAVVILRSGFSDAVIKGENASIVVLGDPEQSIKSGVIKNIVDYFTIEVLRRRTIIETVSDILAPYSSINPQEIQRLIPQWLKEIEDKEDIVIVNPTTASKNIKSIPPMDYYAVGMGVMYLLFATNAGAETIFEERRLKTYDRLKTTPVSDKNLFVGKILGIFFVALFQFLLIFLFTTLVYRVNWGSSITGLIALAFSSVLAFSGFSTLFASIAKSEQQIGNLGPALAMIFGFLGGGMWPVFTFPSWMNLVSRFTPNRWAIDGFLKLMEQNAKFYEVLPQCIVLLAMAGLFFLVGTSRLRKRGT